MSTLCLLMFSYALLSLCISCSCCRAWSLFNSVAIAT